MSSSVDDGARDLGARVASSSSSTRFSPLLVRFGTIFVCGALPVVVLVLLFVESVRDNAVATDLLQFRQAAQAVLHGRNPYDAAIVTTWGGPFPYPPLPAIAAIPLTTLSHQAAGLVVMGALVVAVLAVLAVLDVRDWRCYGIVLLWPPVISAIQTGNVTLWFALAAALAWRYRDRAALAGSAIGLTLATKFFLWPLGVWFAATRRWLAAALSALVGAGLIVLSWAVIGFAGFVDYPALLHKLDSAVGDDSYTIYNLGLELGLPSTISRVVWLAVGLALLGAIVVVARRGDERRAFILAIAAALSLTPIVWLHYLALLVVAVALARPHLSALWFLPLALVVTPGSGHHTLFQLSFALVVVVVTIGLALRTESEERAAPVLEPAAVGRAA